MWGFSRGEAGASGQVLEKHRKMLYDNKKIEKKQQWINDLRALFSLIPSGAGGLAKCPWGTIYTPEKWKETHEPKQ